MRSQEIGACVKNPNLAADRFPLEQRCYDTARAAVVSPSGLRGSNIAKRSPFSPQLRQVKRTNAETMLREATPTSKRDSNFNSTVLLWDIKKRAL